MPIIPPSLLKRQDFTERAEEGEAREDWCTPWPWVERVANVRPGGIGLDPFSNPSSVVRAEYNFGMPDYDAFTYDWKPYVRDDQVVYVNGPYSRYWSPRVARLCAERADNEDVGVIQLCPARLSEVWFHEYILDTKPTAIAFPKGRLKFWLPDGRGGYVEQNAAKFPSCFVYWSGDKYVDSRGISPMEAFSLAFDNCVVWPHPWLMKEWNIAFVEGRTEHG